MMKILLEYMTSPCTQCFTRHGKCTADTNPDCLKKKEKSMEAET